jgi:ketosteroid isomerase-like protein
VKTPLAAMILLPLSTQAFADDTRSLVQQLQQKWLQAYNSGDAAALTALYTKDAIMAPAGMAQPIIGETNLRKYFDSDLKQRLINLFVTSTESQQMDTNTIVDAGVRGGDIPGENGKLIHINGSYIVTIAHQGSDWLMRTDAGNVVPPAPEK